MVSFLDHIIAALTLNNRVLNVVYKMLQHTRTHKRPLLGRPQLIVGGLDNVRFTNCFCQNKTGVKSLLIGIRSCSNSLELGL
jgi:hypothetical protein